MKAGVYCVVCVLVFVAVSSQERVRFDGHKVVNVAVKTEDEFRAVLDKTRELGLDVWQTPKHLNSTFHIRTDPVLYNIFVQFLDKLGLPFDVIINDVQKVIDQVDGQGSRTRRQSTSHFDLNSYHSYQGISDYLKYVVAHSTAHVAHVSLGMTSEGRQLELLKISSSSSSSSSKPAVLIDAGIHAREWIAPATALYILDKLAFNSENDVDVHTLLNHFDFYVLPVLNPDGYEYSRLSNRMWRKNRSHISPSSPNYSWMTAHCRGVDLNRNFGFHWNPRVGGSSNPCEDVYAGDNEFSEAESKDIAAFLHQHGHSIKAYLTMHSYGQFWLYPWGYTHDLPSDYADLDAAAHIGANTLYSYRHTRYTIGSSTRTLYAAAGGSDDYAKGGAGVKYSYTIELPPSDHDSQTGFLLPESQIHSVGLETWAGFKSFLKHLMSEF